MKILGIETSCDETAAAVVEDGVTVLSNIVASQVDIHADYGGVVPEVAARSHIEVMWPVINEALDTAGTDLRGIDGIAVTYGPGLIGSLLIGTLTARTLASLTGKPLYPVNHVEAHTYATFLTDKRPGFPLLSLTVSGGHTQLILFTGHGSYRMLGRTHDDAAGEAFDKVAKILGLPYPGGPSVSRAAEAGNPHAYRLPKPKTPNPMDFSFSGLKTAVLRTAQVAVGGDHRTPSYDLPRLLTDTQRLDLAASFQSTVVDILCDHLVLAYQQTRPRSIAVVGGVAANRALREAAAKRLPHPVIYAPMDLCTDNAAMIASRGFFMAQARQSADPDRVTADPVLAM